MLGKKPKSFGYFNQEVVGLNAMELKQSEILFCQKKYSKWTNKEQDPIFTKRSLIVTLKK